MRPVIAAKLDTPFVVRLLCMDPIYARQLLDSEIPEGAPWQVIAPDPCEFMPGLTQLRIRKTSQWVIQASIPDEWYGAPVGQPNSPERIAEIRAAREARTEQKPPRVNGPGTCVQCAPGYGHNNTSYTTDPDSPHDGPGVQW